MKRLVPFAIILAALSGCAFRAAVPGARFGVAVPGGYGRFPATAATRLLPPARLGALAAGR